MTALAHPVNICWSEQVVTKDSRKPEKEMVMALSSARTLWGMC